MKAFLFGACIFLLSIYIKTSSGITTRVIKMKRSLNDDSSGEGFNMFINEHGFHFNEKLIFNNDKKIIIHHVPAHRDLPESYVLIDFKSKVVVIRQPAGDGEVCRVRPRTPNEPSFDDVKNGMETVSTGKYKINEGERLISVEWVQRGHADRSNLSKLILEFCEGLDIYQLEEADEDEITVENGEVRIKRQEKPLPLCQTLDKYSFLSNCPNTSGDYVTKCKFTLRLCVHWITCTNGVIESRNEGGINCDAKHKYDQAICCDLECPAK